MVTIKHEVPVDWKGKSVEGPPTANSSRASSVTLPLESDDEDYDDRDMGLGGLRAQDNDIQRARQFFLAQQNEENHHHNLKRKSVDNAYGDVTATREQEHKTTLMRRGHSEDVATRMARDVVQAEIQDYNMQDYHTQLLLLEQQNKKRLMMARKEQDDAIANFNVEAKEAEECNLSPQRGLYESSAVEKDLDHYQFQLMLLEILNKKRLRVGMNRRDHEGFRRAQCEECQDWYEAQIRILEHLNERRLSLHQLLVQAGTAEDPFEPCNLQRENERFEKAMQDLRNLVEEQMFKPQSRQLEAGPHGQHFYSATQDLESAMHNDIPGCSSFQARETTVIEESTPKYPNFELCFNRVLVEYQIQLMLFEGQNRERLLQAKISQASSFETPQGFKLQEYENELAVICQATKERELYDRFLKQRPSSIKIPTSNAHPINPEDGTSIQSDYDVIQAYTIHMMLTNLQSKLKLLAVQPTGEMNPSYRSSRFYANDPPPPPPPPTSFVTSLDVAASQALREYQAQILSIPLDQLPPLDNLTIQQLTSHKENQEKLQALGTVPHPQNFQHPANGSSYNGQGYGMMLMLMEQNTKLVQKLKERIENPAPSTLSPNKKPALTRERFLIQLTEPGATLALPANWEPGPAMNVDYQRAVNTNATQDLGHYQMKPAVQNEPQSVQHYMYGVPVAINQYSGFPMHPQYTTGNHALQIYQDELMGCAQQTKADTTGVKSPEDTDDEANNQTTPSSSPSTVQDYQMRTPWQGPPIQGTGMSSNFPVGGCVTKVSSGPGGIFYNGQNVPGCNMLPTHGNHALQDYQTQLMLLEQQNRKRKMISIQEQARISESEKALDAQEPLAFEDRIADSKQHMQNAQPSQSNHTIQNQQMSQRLLAQQKKKRDMAAAEAQYFQQREAACRQAQKQLKEQEEMTAYISGAPVIVPPGKFSPMTNHALPNYQMQLMLLEQQKKKRLMMARQRHDSQTSTQSSKAPEIHAYQELQAPSSIKEQLRLTQPELQNKQRLLLPDQIQDSQTVNENSRAFEIHVGEPYFRPENFQALQQSMERAGCQTQMAYHDPQIETTKENTSSAGTGSSPYMCFQSMMRGPSTSNCYQGPTGNHALHDYEAQLDLLALQNKKRALMTTRCQEPENETGESSTGVDLAQLQEVDKAIEAAIESKKH